MCICCWCCWCVWCLRCKCCCIEWDRDGIVIILSWCATARKRGRIRFCGKLCCFLILFVGCFVMMKMMM